MIETKLSQIYNDFKNQELKYCHWKSNANLSKSFESKADFDLLISELDLKLFNESIAKYGLKRRSSTANNVYPGMIDYLGLDEVTGKIFHFHVHFKLIFGKKLQKNIRWPIEEYILDTAIWDKEYNIKIIKPELELLLLALRAILKVNFGIKNLLKSLFGKNIFQQNFIFEWEFLKNRIDNSLYRRYGMSLLPDISDILINFVEQDIRKISFYQLAIYCRRVLNSLKSYKIYSTKDFSNERRIKRLSARSSKTWLDRGGMSFAFVGADGSGKSSTVMDIKKWLGWKLSVQTFYMGLPKKYLTWKALVLFHKIFMKLGFIELAERIDFLKWIFVAKLRYKKFADSEMVKNQGKIIIFDRFPLKEFWEMDEPMDGPRIKKYCSLREVEQKYYNKIGYPDYIFALKVNEKQSLDRKSESKGNKYRKELKNKIIAIEKLSRLNNDKFIFIDTTKGKAETIYEIKQKIWMLL